MWLRVYIEIWLIAIFSLALYMGLLPHYIRLGASEFTTIFWCAVGGMWPVCAGLLILAEFRNLAKHYTSKPGK